jgi:simple sugar transport system permease protein
VGQDRTLAAFNLQQTLILATPLMLTGLAVAFAFRCGLFNIGGQGQYVVGSIVAVWLATSWSGLNGPLHIVLTIVIASLAGGAFAAVAGLLKATVGAHEVISTIMLNWIAYWTGSYLFGLGGPLQNATQQAVPISNDIVPNTHLHVFWGDALFQGLHVGFFVALAALLAYWVVLSRTTLGFEVRAVGFNPDAARYGGISVARNYVTAMAISGSFAALAGAIDILGWRFRLGELDIQTSSIGFTGIAVALLGRNTAVGVFFGALLFGGLINGTSGRHLSADVFPPQLAGNLTLIIQGLIILFIAADVLVLYLWQQRKRVKTARAAETVARAPA